MYCKYIYFCVDNTLWSLKVIQLLKTQVYRCFIHSNLRTTLSSAQSTGCIKTIGTVLKLIIFTSMVNRIINTGRNERVIQQVYDTYLQMFDVCILRHTAHIEAIVQFLPYSVQQVRCDGLHSRGNSVLQIR